MTKRATTKFVASIGLLVLLILALVLLTKRQERTVTTSELDMYAREVLNNDRSLTERDVLSVYALALKSHDVDISTPKSFAFRSSGGHETLAVYDGAEHGGGNEHAPMICSLTETGSIGAVSLGQGNAPRAVAPAPSKSLDFNRAAVRAYLCWAKKVAFSGDGFVISGGVDQQGYWALLGATPPIPGGQCLVEISKDLNHVTMVPGE